MKKLVLISSLVLAVCGLSTAAFADTCAATASAKNLAGAAKNSFLTKCTKDATADCDKQAADKKIYGAAKASFTKKCVSDATGM